MPGHRTYVPTYRELLARTDRLPVSSWEVFGPDDQLGRLNCPLSTLVPSIAGTRPAAEHHMNDVAPVTALRRAN